MLINKGKSMTTFSHFIEQLFPFLKTQHKISDSLQITSISSIMSRTSEINIKSKSCSWSDHEMPSFSFSQHEHWLQKKMKTWENVCGSHRRTWKEAECTYLWILLFSRKQFLPQPKLKYLSWFSLMPYLLYQDKKLHIWTCSERVYIGL